jgi:hypothetical protein
MRGAKWRRQASLVFVSAPRVQRVDLRRAALVLLFALVFVFLIGRATVTVRDADLSDFRCLWTAGHVLSQGRDPYDRSVWLLATGADPARLPPCDATFIYPLWTAAAFVPFSLLPEAAALAVWEALLIAALVAGVWLTGRAFRLGGATALLLLLVLASHATYSAVANAQLGPILFAAIAALTLTLASRRYGPAALAWCALLIKPHVVALVLGGTIAAARDRTFRVIAAVGIALCVVGSLVIAVRWPLELLAELAAQRRAADSGLATFWGLAAAMGLPEVVAPIAAVLAVAILFAFVPSRSLAVPERMALLVPASLLITPYARPHDHVILAVSWALVLAAARRAEGRSRLMLAMWLVGAAVVLPWTVALLSPAGVSSAGELFVPLVSGALVLVALSRYTSPFGGAVAAPGYGIGLRARSVAVVRAFLAY